jgi:elongation factor P
MATTQDVSNGMFLKYNGELVQIFEWQHRTPGNLRAFYQARMRNLKNGKIVENRFRSGESVEIVRVEYKTMQYLYKDGESMVCMDPNTFDQIYVPMEYFGDSVDFLKEEMEVTITFHEDQPIMAAPPTFVELEITYSEPAVKGDSSGNALKSATLETGAEVMVPMFVQQGEKIKVDTRTRAYVERVK